MESRQARRQLSRSALQHELQTKGVAREFIDLALEDVGREDELQAARELADKKLRSLADLPLRFNSGGWLQRWPGAASAPTLSVGSWPISLADEGCRRLLVLHADATAGESLTSGFGRTYPSGRGVQQRPF